MSKAVDARMTCPNCGRLVELREVAVESNADITECAIAALCRSCSRVYTAEQWRRFYGPGGRCSTVEGLGSEAEWGLDGL